MAALRIDSRFRFLLQTVTRLFRVIDGSCLRRPTIVTVSCTRGSANSVSSQRQDKDILNSSDTFSFWISRRNGREINEFICPSEGSCMVLKDASQTSG